MKLILGDIVKMEVDAIATSSHSDLKPCPGIRAAIFTAADGVALTRACEEIGRCRIGRAVVTPSCGLPCKYIIHVAGPGWYSGHKNEQLLFADCYLHALYKARAYHCRTVALPLMFSGEYHLPRATALTIVCQVVSHFEQRNPEMEITLVLYKESIYQLALRIYQRQQEPPASGPRPFSPFR